MNIPNWVERCTPTVWFVLPFSILIVVWDVQLYSFVFLFFSRGQERGTLELNQRSISTFLYICLSIYKNHDMCSGLLFNYSEIYVPFNVHINKNESMNAQWVLSPLSLSFNLVFSSPLSTSTAVPTLFQISLQPFNSIQFN